MSTPSDAKAISYESVAEHIAKRKPPLRTYSFIFFATANFAWDTLLNPSSLAFFSKDFFCSLYQLAFLKEA